MKNKIAVIAAHPDDEILGCGGAMTKHVAEGDQVYVLIMAEGATSRDISKPRSSFSDMLSELEIAAKKANAIIGVNSVEILKFPDNQMDSVPRIEIVKAIEKFLLEVGPNTIYTHHAGDVNIDHRRIHESVVTACRPMPGSKVEKILFFEVLSSTEWQTVGSFPYFMPNWYANISGLLEKKLEALQCYEMEMRAWPHARSYQAVKNLAELRGATIGVEAAEAFMLGRYINY